MSGHGNQAAEISFKNREIVSLTLVAVDSVSRIQLMCFFPFAPHHRRGHLGRDYVDYGLKLKERYYHVISTTSIQIGGV